MTLDPAALRAAALAATRTEHEFVQMPIDGVRLISRCKHCDGIESIVRHYGGACRNIGAVEAYKHAVSSPQAILALLDSLAAAEARATEARRMAIEECETPRVVDDDREEITITLAGKEIRGWSYANEQERRVKMLCAREFVEGWFQALESVR